MTKRPRGLTSVEAELWARVARTVTPIEREVSRPTAQAAAPAALLPPPAKRIKGRIPAPLVAGPPSVPTRTLSQPSGLDSTWERKLAHARVEPDFTLDLHGLGLSAAHTRLEHGLALAIAQQARLVLVIAGRPRPVDAADRGETRGAIRAKLLDWLAAGSHAGRIAAVRPAHRRHGGAGALYVVLRRERV
jgi:DNA-nicking Smr family endonuclease